MQRRPFGKTGLFVSALGFGAGHIGTPAMTEDHAGTIINRAVDRGINFIDTARGIWASLQNDHSPMHLGDSQIDRWVITQKLMDCYF